MTEKISIMNCLGIKYKMIPYCDINLGNVYNLQIIMELI